MTQPTGDQHPFIGFIADHRGGRAAVEMTDKMHEVTEAVKATGKPGSVTLTISIAPLKDAVDVLKVTDVVKGKIPELPRAASVYFSDDQGNLLRDNPRQPGLFEAARTIEGAAEPRRLDHMELAAGERDEDQS